MLTVKNVYYVNLYRSLSQFFLRSLVSLTLSLMFMPDNIQPLKMPYPFSNRWEITPDWCWLSFRCLEVPLCLMITDQLLQNSIIYVWLSVMCAHVTFGSSQQLLCQRSTYLHHSDNCLVSLFSSHGISSKRNVSMSLGVREDLWSNMFRVMEPVTKKINGVKMFCCY